MPILRSVWLRVAQQSAWTFGKSGYKIHFLRRGAIIFHTYSTRMSYLTPAQILNEAPHADDGHQNRRYGAYVNPGVAPAQLYVQNTQQQHYPPFNPYQNENPAAVHSASRHDMYGTSISPGLDSRHSNPSIQFQDPWPMMGMNGSEPFMSPSPSVAVGSFSSHHPCATPYIPPNPLSERRNSQEDRFVRGAPEGFPKRKGSRTSGHPYAYPEHLIRSPLEYQNSSQEVHGGFEHPGYANPVPAGYRRNSRDVQKQTQQTWYSTDLGYSVEPRNNHATVGPIRSSSGNAVHNHNPYPFASPNQSYPQSQEISKPRRQDEPKRNRYPADPFPILADGRGPTNHIRIPQTVYYDVTDISRCMSFSKPITFRMKNFAELGVRLSHCLDENQSRHPNIEDMDAKLFANDEVYREIRLKILWPGYSEFPFTRRINIRKGEMTRITLLFNVVTAIADFVKKIQTDWECTCEPGLERWKLTGKGRLKVDKLILTGIVHRGGPNWQPEIWCPDAN
ncbi:hypothetical protein F5878DRAFT_724304 [Lentinula raphanica]|uniref:Uncharacterized protein n=1 Tax=Lentinula raphanica TaxID=153919 RepID=A0AA38PBU6_9AGAR|nr:hypothetical protein F5878DRAFT_724304 [Lentinula raphanica]